MFLKSIRVENVRCLHDAEISLETDREKVRKWTLLVGDNGTGKSTLLKAVALLMAGSEGLMELLHDADSWIRLGAESCKISGVLTTVRGRERKIALTIRRGQSIRRLLQVNAKSLKPLDDALERNKRSYLTIGYGGLRHTNDSGFVGMDSRVFHHPRVRACSTLFADHAPMIPFELWAMDFHSRRPSAGSKIIRETLDGLSPSVAFKKFDRERGVMLFDTPDGLIPLRYLSGGYRSMVGFCGDLLYRITDIFEDYNRPLEAQGLLLIDELGLNLHPIWQRTLIEFLTHKLPNFQLLVTTNSPLTAHQAGEGELFYLQREEPTSPPTPRHFEGSPRKLLLHQLILSPVFGVETANSYDTECERVEFGKLRSKSRKSAKDRKRMKELEEELSDVTQWDEVTEGDRKLSDLLTKIERKLSNR